MTTDTLTQFSPDRRLPWSFDAGYTSDAYSWHIKNTQPLNRLYLNDALVSSETGNLSMDLQDLWNTIERVNGATCAVIDGSGFDYEHPDLTSNVISAEKATGGANPDIANHGTQVAGLIGAVGNNGIGAAGVCWRVPLILLQTDSRLDAEARALDMRRAILRAADLGAKVICIPQSVPNSPLVYTALLEIGARDVMVVCAAMNYPADHDTVLDYPTSWRLPHVLTISNCMRDGQLLPGGAGWGKNTVFAGAPGRRLPVLLAGGGYGFASGTSEACGVAAGWVAFLRKRFPFSSAGHIRARLAAGILPVPALAGKTITGGMLHVNSFFINVLTRDYPTDNS